MITRQGVKVKVTDWSNESIDFCHWWEFPPRAAAEPLPSRGADALKNYPDDRFTTIIIHSTL